jgi:prepilin-type N-terminal cleavage/methylation domain-containing protein
MKQSNIDSLGYTLIEIIIVLALMGVFMSLALAGWTNYRDSRTLDEAGLALVSQLRAVRSRAVNGNKPSSGCDNLYGYQVNANLEVNVCCYNGAVSCTNIKTIDINNLVDITVDPGFEVTFLAGNGRVEDAADITLGYHTKEGTVTISESGAEIEWQRTN